MLEVFSTLLTGALSGGATGLLGVLLQRYFDHKSKQVEVEIVKLNHENSLALAKLESEAANRRAEADKAIASFAADAETARSDNQALIAAMENDRASYITALGPIESGKAKNFATIMLTIVDALRGFVRPAMTLYLCALTSYLFIWSKDLAAVHGTGMTATQVHELILQIITTILYVFTTVTLFWFGTRNKQGN